MEHQEALDTHAAEGYLLGDLTAAEYAAFEEHFADCEECFTDVRDAASVVAAVRAAEEKPVQAKGGQHKTIPWFAAAAGVAVAMLSAIGYQGYQVAQLKTQIAVLTAPHIGTEYVLPTDQRGGPVENEVVIDSSREATLSFDITLEPASAPFTCKVVDAQGHPRIGPMAVTADQADAPVTLTVPAKTLEPGEYSLIVSGTGGVSLPEKRFKVR